MKTAGVVTSVLATSVAVVFAAPAGLPDKVAFVCTPVGMDQIGGGAATLPGGAGTVIAGPAGPAGPAGAAGNNGMDGSNGMAGTNGMDGTNGKGGMAGAAGQNGLNGQNGQNGKAGPGASLTVNGPLGGAGGAGGSASVDSKIVSSNTNGATNSNSNSASSNGGTNNNSNSNGASASGGKSESNIDLTGASPEVINAILNGTVSANSTASPYKTPVSPNGGAVKLPTGAAAAAAGAAAPSVAAGANVPAASIISKMGTPVSAAAPAGAAAAPVQNKAAAPVAGAAAGAAPAAGTAAKPPAVQPKTGPELNDGGALSVLSPLGAMAGPVAGAPIDAAQDALGLAGKVAGDAINVIPDAISKGLSGGAVAGLGQGASTAAKFVTGLPGDVAKVPLDAGAEAAGGIMGAVTPKKTQ